MRVPYVNGSSWGSEGANFKRFRQTYDLVSRDERNLDYLIGGLVRQEAPPEKGRGNIFQRGWKMLSGGKADSQEGDGPKDEIKVTDARILFLTADVQADVLAFSVRKMEAQLMSVEGKIIDDETDAIMRVTQTFELGELPETAIRDAMQWFDSESFNPHLLVVLDTINQETIELFARVVNRIVTSPDFEGKLIPVAERERFRESLTKVKEVLIEFPPPEDPEEGEFLENFFGSLNHYIELVDEQLLMQSDD